MDGNDIVITTPSLPLAWDTSVRDLQGSMSCNIGYSLSEDDEIASAFKDELEAIDEGVRTAVGAYLEKEGYNTSLADFSNLVKAATPEWPAKLTPKLPVEQNELGMWESSVEIYNVLREPVPLEALRKGSTCKAVCKLEYVFASFNSKDKKVKLVSPKLVVQEACVVIDAEEEVSKRIDIRSDPVLNAAYQKAMAEREAEEEPVAKKQRVSSPGMESV